MSTAKSRVPEFPEGLEWFNVDAPVALAGQRGRVVLLCFGSFSSIHCQHVLEDLNFLANRYRKDLTIIGVHSTRFPAEMERSHVQKMLNKHHIRHPVIHDPELKLWKRYGIRDWPTQVLIDRDGYIVGALSGDGKRARLEEVIDYQRKRESEFSASGSAAISIMQQPESPSTLSFPGGVLVARDRIYIADSAHNQVIVTSMQGNILRRFGSTSPGFLDGEGVSAAFNNPKGMALRDQFLYVADEGNHAIRRINIRTDEVTTVAGTGKAGSNFAGSTSRPDQMQLNSPTDVALESGTLYIAMAGMHQVWSLSLISNTLKVFSGCGREGLRDGSPNVAEFAQPSGLAVYGRQLYTVDATSSAIRCIDMENGSVSTLAGTGLYEYGDQDGLETAAKLQYPMAIEADMDHRMLWVADTYNNKIRRIGVKTRNVSSVILDQALDEPGGLAFHDGTLYIANTNAHEILCLNPDSGHVKPLNVT
ncbi:MAG: thioredoxin-like domain-containing protein, partial [Thiohalobacterales bacterium]|nr:thioredoxin-like domain-containing protein [Thiohalobacterales bacterium]